MLIWWQLIVFLMSEWAHSQLLDEGHVTDLIRSDLRWNISIRVLSLILLDSRKGYSSTNLNKKASPFLKQCCHKTKSPLLDQCKRLKEVEMPHVYNHNNDNSDTISKGRLKNANTAGRIDQVSQWDEDALHQHTAVLNGNRMSVTEEKTEEASSLFIRIPSALNRD